ncbi:hypothetical protein M9H77_03528 [Catharanthus roseus]|uniref:Uncharacterized protein n=1 Tax=Catharanthus roseus TaxID=4058 RepID=A0ACC0CBP2_CATRO|nr:hypothetical protein M9H77_03528 [Catharanthus roseus]
MAKDEEALLVESSIPLNHTRDVHILSWAFLLIFLAYGAAQNLESTINTDGNLGTTSLGILYLSFTFFSVIASLVVRKLGSKNALLLGTSGYWFFIAANLIPTWYSMVPASLYLGFAASIIWVAQGTYLTSTASSHANDYNLPEGIVIGKFNGEFWGMFASHQLVGNLITLAMLRDGQEGGTSGGTPLFIIFLFTMSVGTVLMCFLSKRKSKEEERLQDSSPSLYSSVVSLAKASVSLLLDMRILLVIPLILYSGLQAAFVWADFTKYTVKPNLGERGVGGVMAVYGTFDAICSLAAGRLTSGLSSITIIVCGGAVIQAIAFSLLLLKHRCISAGSTRSFLSNDLQSNIANLLATYFVPLICLQPLSIPCSMTSGVLQVIYPLLIAGFLGIGDGVLNTQISALLGILFKHNLEGAFAQFKLWQSLSIAVVFFISPHVAFHIITATMLAALCISFVAFLFLTLKVEAAFSSRASSS